MLVAAETFQGNLGVAKIDGEDLEATEIRITMIKLKQFILRQ